jgi:hypothetical protein
LTPNWRLFDEVDDEIAIEERAFDPSLGSW